MKLEYKRHSWVMPRKKRRTDDQNSSETRKFHLTRQWRNYARQYLIDNPICVKCKRNGIATDAVACDHVVRISAGGSKMDPRNHQALCGHHHSEKSGKESAGYVHPWKLNEYGEKIPASA